MVAPVQRIRDAIRTAEETGEPIEALFLPGGQDTLPLDRAAAAQVGD